MLASKACQVPSKAGMLTYSKQRQHLPRPEMIILTRKEQRFRAEVKFTYAKKKKGIMEF